MRIDETLWFERAGEGAVLFAVSTGEEFDDMYAVNMSAQTISELHQALTREAVSWTNADGSLQIGGDSGGAQLVFTSQGPPTEVVRTWILEGPRWASFKGAVQALAQ